MDQNSSQQLDPKLKEIYEKVMGAPNSSQNSAPPDSSQAKPASPPPPATVIANATPKNPLAPPPIPTPPPIVPQPVQPVPPAQTMPTPAQTQPMQAAVPGSVAPSFSLSHIQAPSATSMPTAGIPAEKKKSSKKVFLVIGGVIFLLIYAVFWVKVFGIKLPFLG